MYYLFWALAGVRAPVGGKSPKYLPKGIPIDISIPVRQKLCDFDGWHGLSYLNLKELNTIDYKKYGGDVGQFETFFDKVISRMEQIENDGVFDSRIVFWFDN